MAVRGRAFLSEHADDKRFCYYKGGLAKRNPPFDRRDAADYAFGQSALRASLLISGTHN
jgi:hypothetical protein